MNKEDFMIFTKQGMAIKFETKDIASIGRVTSGVKGINLTDGDEVVSSFPIKDNNLGIAIIGSNGYGKISSLSDFTIQGRGGKGVKLGQEIAGTELVQKEDNLLLIGSPNSICINVNELPIQGRTTMGVKVAQNQIKKIVKI